MFHYDLKASPKSEIVSFKADTLAEALEEARKVLKVADPIWVKSWLCLGEGCLCERDK